MHSFVRAIFLVALLGTCAGCKPQTEPIEVVGFVPIVSVLSNQKYYHNKHVAVAGYLVLDDRHRPVLYMDELAARRTFPADSLCVHIDSKYLPQLLLMTNHSVAVFGRYNAKDRGDGGVHSGSIIEIERIFPLHEVGSQTNSVGLRGLWDISNKPKKLVAPH